MIPAPGIPHPASAIGVLGGTFDPIHYGHLRPAHEVMLALGLAEVRFVPAAIPPHRAPPVASAPDRLAMVQLALHDFPGFRVDDREIRRGGRSYTVDTLESLRAELGDRPLCLLLGADAFLGLTTWHRWEALPELAHLLVMRRPGWAVGSPPSWARARVSSDPAVLAQSPAGRLVFRDVRPQDISGSRIRAALARGDSVHGLLPEPVLKYIHDRQIYGRQDRGV